MIIPAHYIFNFLWSRLSRAAKARSEQRKGAAMQLFNKILTHAILHKAFRGARQSCIVNCCVSPFNFVYCWATRRFRHKTPQTQESDRLLSSELVYIIHSRYKYELDARWPIVYCANGATTILWFFSSGFARSIKLFPSTLCHLADGIAFSHNINWNAYICWAHTYAVKTCILRLYHS